MVDVNVFKGHFTRSDLPQKHVYKVFRWMMHLAESHMLYVLYSFLRFGLHVALQN